MRSHTTWRALGIQRRRCRLHLHTPDHRERVLDALTGVGWSVEVPVGSVTYMINDADDSYEWYGRSSEDIGEVLERLDAPGNLPYTVAVNVYHPDAGTGGMFMAKEIRY